jgi:hypothetical protein
VPTRKPYSFVAELDDCLFSQPAVPLPGKGFCVHRPNESHLVYRTHPFRQRSAEDETAAVIAKLKRNCREGPRVSSDGPNESHLVYRTHPFRKRSAADEAAAVIVKLKRNCREGPRASSARPDEKYYRFTFPEFNIHFEYMIGGWKLVRKNEC